jgi:hypothetical protein
MKLDIGQYPNGTIIRYRRKLYCLQQGLDDRILVDVETGFWLSVETCTWRKFHVIFEPYQSEWRFRHESAMN